MARKLVRGSDQRRVGALPDRIRHARRTAKLTQADLGRALDVVPSAVAQWESTRGTAPTLEHLAQIAVAAKVSFEWLATGRGAARLGAVDEQPAVSSESFARDLPEERLLAAFRRVTRHKRDLIVRWIEDWVG
jgi:transcriptional regulator with XRE-family HTH domain